MRWAVGALVLSIAASSAWASQPPPPPCQDEAYRAFDFWLGEWDVHVPSGQFAGNNSITKAEGGCLIVERWRNAGGGGGQSYNFYNPVTKMWRQVWVSPGIIIDYSGGLEDGAMRLEGEIFYDQTGQKAPFIGTWTPRDDGSVEQAFQEWNAETETWDPWFTGIYTPSAESAED